jgi:ribosomal protein S18 acetylase RimI-like enzyme
MTANILIRDARATDFDAVVDLDEWRLDKHTYWRGIFDRFAVSGIKERFFLIAEKDGVIVGFAVGEIRAWEFGSAPCGWVFALAVSSAVREFGIGRLMFGEMCKRMKQAGVSTVRTMVDRENRLTLSFFRGLGLRTGPYLELEMDFE